MNDSDKKKLDDLVNEFYEYGHREYPESSNSRNKINELHSLKEHWKNGTKDNEGKIPTAEEIGYYIYDLRWHKILPF